jgi:hypothetical protein
MTSRAFDIRRNWPTHPIPMSCDTPFVCAETRHCQPDTVISQNIGIVLNRAAVAGVSGLPGAVRYALFVDDDFVGVRNHSTSRSRVALPFAKLSSDS